MNDASLDKLINAILYEGYSLYPYRLCIKNAKRWMFGCVYPTAHPLVRQATESSHMTTQCLIEGGPFTRLAMQIRFLHLLERRVAAVPRERIDAFAEQPLDDLELDYASSIKVDGVVYEALHEAVERRVEVPEFQLGNATEQSVVETFSFPEVCESEVITAHAAGPHGMIVNQQCLLNGKVLCAACELAKGLYRIDVTIENRSLIEPPITDHRAPTALSAFVSTHTVLTADDGYFVSSIDPAEQFREFASQLKHEGAWPVLVGVEGQRDTMLSSPIILYDYPQIAPESAGDLFDATEIDEILALRILTLSEEEKNQLRSGDERTRQILERTENLSEDHFRKLHGAIRGLRPLEHAGS